jgi:hypothetical protein
MTERKWEKKELLVWKASVERLTSNPRLLEDEAVLKFIAYDKDRSGYLDYNEIKAVPYYFCWSCQRCADLANSV